MSDRLRPLLARALTTFLQPQFGVFLIVFLLSGATLVGYMNSLDGPQYALTRALAEDQSVHIDQYRSLAWPDYAIGRHGNAVSDREPGPSILAVPFHFLGKALNPVMKQPYDGARPKLSSETRTQVMTYLSLVFIVSLGVAYAYTLLRRLGLSGPAAFVTCLLIVFGTLMWKYSASFARQPAVAVLLLLIVLELLLYNREKGNSWRLFLCGVFAGLAVMHDYLVAFPLVFVAIAFLFIERPNARTLLPALLGVAPFALLVLAYNYVTFGELLTSPHQHEAQVKWLSIANNFRTPVHIGLYLNLVSFNPVPDSAVGWLIERPEIYHQMGVRWAQTWTYKGILVQSPYLLFALGGWALFATGQPRLVLYPAAVVLSWLALSSGVTIFWGAASQHDGRYLLPLVPTLGVGLAFFIDAFIRDRPGPRAAAFTWLLVVTALISLYFAWESSVTNFAPNLSGDHRWLPAELFASRTITAGSIEDAVLETFPNVYNLHVMVPLALLLYAAARALFHGARALWAKRPIMLPVRAEAAGSPPLEVPAPSAPVWLAGSVAVCLAVAVCALAVEPFGGSNPLTAGTAAAGQTPTGAMERNVVRLTNLQTLKDALVRYATMNGSVPDTGGKLQSLCRYRASDAGCHLEAVLSPIPVDPGGETSGYWYASDGRSFTLVALWEGDTRSPAQLTCDADIRRQVTDGTRICLKSD